MQRDHDLLCIRYYIERGHSINELLSLTPTEWLFYQLHVDLVAEAQQKELARINEGKGG